MKTPLFIVALFALLTSAKAQHIDTLTGKPYLPNKGVIVTGSTFAPSIQLRNNVKNFYFNGFLEYFFSRRVSLRGECYALLVSTPKPKQLLHNHYILYGAFCHFPIKNFDFFVGLEPGLGVVQTQSTNDLGAQQKSKLGVVPYLSAMAGCRYYIGKFFNFFLETRYIHGKHFDQKAFYLDAISFSAGLGFNFDVLPKK